MADAHNTEEAPEQVKGKSKPELPHCGVIMPISGTDDYPASHWSDMLLLIQEAAKDAKFTCEIVSATGRDDIIHASIVTNIYQNELVVCDVSSRNPNVMLELGLRLASKLPVVIIFDEVGNYPFDIGTIRYLPYRRDMRYYDTAKFRKELTDKILEVHKKYKDGKYKSFLSHFKNVEINLDELSTETQTLKQALESIDKRLNGLENNSNYKEISNNSKSLYSSALQVGDMIISHTIVNFIINEIIKKEISYPLSTNNIMHLYNALKKEHPRSLNTRTASEAADIIISIAKKYFRID